MFRLTLFCLMKLVSKNTVNKYSQFIKKIDIIKIIFSNNVNIVYIRTEIICYFKKLFELMLKDVTAVKYLLAIATSAILMASCSSAVRFANSDGSAEAASRSGQAETLSIGTVFRGKASFYHDKFEGRQTANGEIFSQSKFTAAHKTLSFGTKLKVTNLRNGRQAIVVINDRGPFVAGRIIDLSRAAAEQLDMINEGVADVECEVID